MAEETIKKKKPPKDKDWDELYMYVKNDLLGYKDKKLPQQFVLRLLGLKDGKFMANSHVEAQASYPYKTILLTFKLNRGKIDSYMMSTTFKDERHLFNGLMVIVESEINNTVDILNRKVKAEAKIEIMDISVHSHDSAEYKSKGNTTKVNDRLRGLL
jgi:hypothetical protein